MSIAENSAYIASLGLICPVLKAVPLSYEKPICYPKRKVFHIY